MKLILLIDAPSSFDITCVEGGVGGGGRRVEADRRAGNPLTSLETCGPSESLESPDTDLARVFLLGRAGADVAATAAVEEGE